MWDVAPIQDAAPVIIGFLASALAVTALSAIAWVLIRALSGK